MATSGSEAPARVVDIPAEDYDTARQYIIAIIARDRRSAFDAAYAQRVTAWLWNRFFVEYARVSSGPQARHGAEAVHLALSRI